MHCVHTGISKRNTSNRHFERGDTFSRMVFDSAQNCHTCIHIEVYKWLILSSFQGSPWLLSYFVHYATTPGGSGGT